MPVADRRADCYSAVDWIWQGGWGRLVLSTAIPSGTVSMDDYNWTVRVERVREQEVKVYSRNNAFVVGRQASFREADPHPSAVEYLLGALGGDLLNGFQVQAARQRVAVDAL